MNKFTSALALGAGLVLSLATPNVQADPIVQTLTPVNMTAAQFDSLYTASTPVLSQPYSFMNTSNAGTVESQVFTGTGVAAGTYAYAYQVSVSPTATDTSTGQPTSVNSTSMLFNNTPTVTNFTGMNAPGYVITGGSIGNITAPAGSVVQTPTSIAWLPSSTTGSLTFQYLNPTTSTGPLQAGSNSGTIVVISTQPFTQQYVSVQNPEPQNGYPLAYSPTTGSISPVPAPEPATILGWTSVLAAMAVGHRYRRSRTLA